MPKMTVKELAQSIGVAEDRLLSQLQSAGINVENSDDTITDEEKRALLNYIEQSKRQNTPGKDQPRKTLSSKGKVSASKDSVSDVRQGNKVISVKRRRPSKQHLEKLKAQAEQSEESTSSSQTQHHEQQKPSEETAKAKQQETDTAVATEQTEQQINQQTETSTHEHDKSEKEQPEQAVESLTSEHEQTSTSADELEQQPKSKRQKRKAKKANKNKYRETKEEKEERQAWEAFESKQTKQEQKKSTDPDPSESAKSKSKVKEIAIPETIVVSELAHKMAVKATEIIQVMMNMGAVATINQVIDQETAALVVEEMGHQPKLLKEESIEETVEEQAQEDQGELQPKAPVVTIMGHVDHGKTSLLDYIRRAKVTSSEAGGITQHIGAYQVHMDKGDITFLDTPGHEAFTAMRARGAQATDIVILVVAADDGVKPQTVEAIQHAQAAGVPLVVAINKIDKPEIDLDRLKYELAQQDVISEEWGGQSLFQNISAKTGQGIDELLECVLLQSEMLDLNAPVEGPGRGIVIESRVEKGRGPVSTILVQKGELNKGDVLLVGTEYGRVRAMIGDDGRELQSVGPSMPVEVLGLSGSPDSGEKAVVLQEERKAREVALYRQGKYREVKLAKQQAAQLENVFSQMHEGEVNALNIIIKADMIGSKEAVVESLKKLSTDEVQVKIVADGVGAITESDINLAIASQAIVIGFNVRATSGARKLAEAEGIDLRYYSVIYDLIDQVKSALSGLLAPKREERIVGNAKVQEVFRSTKMGSIAGCKVTEGVVKRHNPIRVLRDNVVIYEGQLESLKRYTEDVNEVQSGKECGIGVKNYNDVRVGDNIEVYEIVEIKREL